jgi:GDP-4-dehydro-6-deoxy-D-mannose reductase
MKVFITGGGGFAGSHLAEYLLEQGHEVVALVRPDSKPRNLQHLLSKIRVVSGDILDLARLTALIKETHPQRIYHLAALSSAVNSFQIPGLAYDVNFTGTFNLLWAWRQTQRDGRFLSVSSSQVYGSVSERELPLREDAALRFANPYAASKAAAELLALDFFRSYGLPIVRVRPFNHTGPRQDSSFVCSSLARQLVEIELGMRDPAVKAGNLKVTRDFSDVRDIVRGYHLALEKGQPGEVYQLCSGHPVSLESILASLTASASKRVPILVDESRLRPKDAPTMWGDPSKAERVLGWKPQHNLQSTLLDLKQYWEDFIRRQAEVSIQGTPRGLSNS